MRYLTIFMSFALSAFAFNLTPSAQIPGISGSAYQNVVSLFIPSTQQVMAVTTDANTQFPMCAMFDGMNWFNQTAIPMGSSSGVYFNVGLSFDMMRNQVVCAWADKNTRQIYYAVYDVGMQYWITPGTPMNGNSAFIDVKLASDYSGNTVAVWGDIQGFHAGFYSVYSYGSWSPPQQVGGFTQYNYNIAYNPNTNQMVAVWGDEQTWQPHYSVYSNGTWSDPQTMPLGSANGVSFDMTVVFNNYMGNMMAAFINAADNVPYYTTFDGMSWATPTPITTSVNAFHNVCLALGDGMNQIVASWETLSGNVPYMATYNGNFWTTIPVPIASQNETAEYNVNISYMPNGAFPGPVITWVNSSQMPLYSTGTTNAPPSTLPPYMPPPPPGATGGTGATGIPFIPGGISPPGSIDGNQYQIVIPVNKKYIDTITWTPSNSMNVVAYNVYRDGMLVATVNANSPLQFTDYAISHTEQYQYSVTAVDAFHNESAPVVFFVP